MPSFKFHILFLNFLLIGILNGIFVNGQSADFDKALIESAFLINLDTFSNSESSSNLTARRLKNTSSTSIEQIVDNSNSYLPDTTTLTDSLSSAFNSFTDENLLEATSHAIKYLTDNKSTFNLSDADVIAGTKSITMAFLKSSVSDSTKLNTLILDLPHTVLSNFIPEKINSWNGSIPLWTKDLCQVMMESIHASGISDDSINLQTSIAKGSITSLFKILSESKTSSGGFTPSINSVDISRSVADSTMLFGGTANFMRFHPEKTRFLEFASKGLTDGLYSNHLDSLTTEKVQGFSKILGDSTILSSVEFISSLQGDNSLFSFEALKAISTGLTIGSVYNSSISKADRDNSIPEIAAESISKAISYQAIDSNLKLKTGYELNRVAESTASGSAMGAQIASILDKALEYQDGWELFSRNTLAKATSKGSANGAVNASSQYIENDPNVQDVLDKTTKREILDIANGSALGSMLGTTGLSFYYPTMMKSIINHTAQGAATGGITASNLVLVEKPKGVTEEFEVEISRSISHGSATGALFQIVSLLEDSMPDKRSFDTLTIEAAEAVSYGSTYGGILGGIDAGEDSVSLKQAVYQGTLEGSKVGTSLGLGYEERVAEIVSIPADNQIKKVIKSANDDAADKANSSMAVKAIQTSAQDMLLLMRKFNINPKFTNPTRLFTNPDENNKDNFIFKDKFPFASPI